MPRKDSFASSAHSCNRKRLSNKKKRPMSHICHMSQICARRPPRTPATAEHILSVKYVYLSGAARVSFTYREHILYVYLSIYRCTYRAQHVLGTLMENTFYVCAYLSIGVPIGHSTQDLHPHPKDGLVHFPNVVQSWREKKKGYMSHICHMSHPHPTDGLVCFPNVVQSCVGVCVGALHNIYIYIHTYIHTYICMNVCIRIYTYIYMYVCVCIYTYTYVHIYIYTYIHIYIYTYICI